MITKYFSKVIVRFNPFGKEANDMVISLISAKVARSVLAAIPPTQRNMGTQIQSEIISDYNKVKPLVKVTYKDKKEMEVDPSNMNFQELANHFDRHSKQLDLKHMLEMH
ncbi:AAB_G0042730.mRNA.1.CDS.1 [Saccharomyces cerevisiae]|nr:AAB_G0042730.mRNA.1.CDS.1 [Saccharomyces cerevisiae]